MNQYNIIDSTPLIFSQFFFSQLVYVTELPVVVNSHVEQKSHLFNVVECEK